MRLHKPTAVLYNGCGAIALATVTGRTPEEFYSHGWYCEGHYQGMLVEKMHLLLRDEFPDRVAVVYSDKQLSSILRPKGRGIAIIHQGEEAHAVSYDGLMVYDTFTSGRWMWVHDYPCRKWKIYRLFVLEV